MGTAAAFFAATIIAAGASMASGTTFLYSEGDPDEVQATEVTESAEQSSAENVLYYIDGLLDINVAGTDELIQLPGIGEVLAERIIEYREENGGFKDLEELQLVKGIGEKKYAELIKYITINLDQGDINENSGS